MPSKRRRKTRTNPIDWAKLAHWFEAEGTKRKTIPLPGRKWQSLEVVSQDIERREIVDTICDELREAGFHTAKRSKNRTQACEIWRVEEVDHFLKNVKPHFISKQMGDWAQRYIDAIALRKPRKPRIPFKRP